MTLDAAATRAGCPGALHPTVREPPEARHATCLVPGACPKPPNEARRLGAPRGPACNMSGARARAPRCRTERTETQCGLAWCIRCTLYTQNVLFVGLCIRFQLALRVALFMRHGQRHSTRTSTSTWSASRAFRPRKSTRCLEIQHTLSWDVEIKELFDRDGDGVPDRINHDARGLVQPLPVPGHHDGTHRRHRRHEDDRRCDCPGVTVTTCDVDDASNTCTHLAPCAPFWKNKINQSQRGCPHHFRKSKTESSWTGASRLSSRVILVSLSSLSLVSLVSQFLSIICIT